MTIRALTGIVCLNLAYAFVGLSLLWGLRALRTWGEVGLLAGLGYLVGLSAFGVLWTGLLVVGVPFGGAWLAGACAVQAEEGDPQQPGLKPRAGVPGRLLRVVRRRAIHTNKD